MKMQWMMGILACVAAFGAQAQYKYIGPDGRVIYSDQPPPPTAKVLEKNVGGAKPAGGGADLPFVLQNAMKTYPVTLYTAGNCGSPCSEGRSYLNKRGVPFTEKTVNTADDAVKFKKDMGTDQLPLLVVGNSKQAQWQQDAWEGALSAAGYPSQSLLPPGYKNPAPVAVAPQAAPATSTASNAAGPAGISAPAAPAPAPAPDGSKPAWFKGF